MTGEPTPLRAARGPGGTTRWLTRTVLGIGLASLFSDVAHEMATSVTPALLASMGAGSGALGAIEGIADGLSSFAKLLSGMYVGQLTRRKPFAALGYAVTASAMASLAMATRSGHVLAARAFGWVGRGARGPIRNVLLSEDSSEATYGRAFGFERAMDSAGAMIGPLLALGLSTMVGARTILWMTCVPGVLAVLAISFLVREKHHDPEPRRPFSSTVRELPPEFRRLLFGVGLAGLGDFSNTLLILWATQAWTPRLGAARAASLAIAFYAGYNLVYTISCWVAGWLSDRYPRRNVLAAGYALAVAPALMLLAPGDSYAKFAAIFALSGVYIGFYETVESSCAAALLTPSSRGIGFGILASVNGVGDILSSVVVGLLWTVSPSVAMTWVVVTSLAGATVVWFPVGVHGRPRE